MDKNFKDIFNSSEIQIPVGLRGGILERIEKEQRNQQRRKKVLLLSGILASVIGLLAAGVYFGSEILSSEFWNMAMLGLTDAGVVAYNWQDYVESLLETLPTVSIALTLLPIFMGLLLLRQYGKLGEQNKLSFRN